jgi:hypothetical protein
MIAAVGAGAELRSDPWDSKTRKLGEHRLDAGHVARDLLVGEQLARLVLARGIADLGRAAAHQHERPVAAALQPAQDHDLHQAADMQAVGGAVEPDIGGRNPAHQALVERLEVGYLVNEAAFMDDAEEVRFRGRRHSPGTCESVQREAVLRSGARSSAAGVCITEVT